MLKLLVLKHYYPATFRYLQKNMSKQKGMSVLYVESVILKSAIHH
jgi:hypothetical protein